MSVKGKTYLYMLLAAILLLAVLYRFYPRPEAEPGVDENGVLTLKLWYTDESLTDYINSAALRYYDDTGVRVEPVLQTGLEYLDAIGQASFEGKDAPDLYIIGTESIERAALAGLTVPVTDPKGVLTTNNYPERALLAVQYRNQRVAYPFYFETAYLLYNATYLEQIADTAMRTDLAIAQLPETPEGDDLLDVVPVEGLPEGYTEESYRAAVLERAGEMIPSSIEDILSMAGSYNAPDGMENFFLWDVSDIFYNYFFTGAYMDLGGEAGDDATRIEICNEDTVRCMQVYQELNQFFSIESKESSYEKVLQSFLEGKTLFTIATTDALRELRTRTATGEFAYNYGVAMLPGVDSEHAARGLSTTECVAVNGFSAHPEEANLLAEYIVYDEAGTLYDRTGKMACVGSALEVSTDATSVVRELYRQSASLPKMMELGNFWVELELAYTQVWNGDDPETVLSSLEAQMQSQIE